MLKGLANAYPSKHNYGHNKLSVERRAQILSCLCEGSSIRATCRMLDCSKDAVLKLVVDAGEACLAYHDTLVHGVTSKRVQVDEVWSFVHAKAKNVPQEHKGEFGYGDVWTWTAIDADTKLMIAWHVGRRDAQAAHTFMNDVASRMANRTQLTSDGNHAYLAAVDEAFNRQIDYAMLVKNTVNRQNPRSATALRFVLARTKSQCADGPILSTFQPATLNAPI